MKKAFWFSSLIAVFAALSFATPPKDILTVDLTCQEPPTVTGGYERDITKLQDSDLPEQIKALEVGDTIFFNSPDGVFTGKCTVAYRDINLVEVRAGYFQPRNNGYNEIWRFTTDQDQMLGQVDYTYLNHEYAILYNDKTKTLTALEPNTKNFTCGGCDGPIDDIIARDGVQQIMSKVEAEQYYTNDWQCDEYVTQNYMIVYTKEAMEEAKSRGGINNVLAQGIVLGTLVLSNSHVRSCFNLVHSQLVDYYNPVGEICNSSLALSSLCNSRNGLEQIEQLRARYGADMCSIAVLMPTYTGLAYVSGGVSGSESSANNCMDVNFVNTTGWIHEDGHNMGGQHYDETGTSGGGLFGHSHGCHNTPPGAPMEYGSIMARSNGIFNYYSSTNIFYDGVPISTTLKCQVALTWEKTRRYAARYRSVPYHAAGDMLLHESFNYPIGSGLMFKEGGCGFASPWYACLSNIFYIQDRDLGDDSAMHEGGSLRICNEGNETATTRRFINWMNYSPASLTALAGHDIWLSVWADMDESSESYGYGGFRFGGSYECFSFYRDGEVNVFDFGTDYKHTFGTPAHYLARCTITTNDTGYAYTDVYLWVNPDMTSEPVESDAVFHKYGYSYWGSNFSSIYIYAPSGFKATFDEFCLGYTFDSVKNRAVPYGFVSMNGDDKIKLRWRNTTKGSVTLWRNTEEDLATAEKLREGDNTFQAYDDSEATPGQTYYYWLTGDFPTPEPRKAVRGIPDVSAECNGEYTIGQGQAAHLSAEGSKGYMPVVRWIVGHDMTLFSTNFYYYDYKDDQIYWPGDYNVEVRVTDRAFRTVICTNTTMLHVTNAYPHVRIWSEAATQMVNLPQVFTAAPTDPGIHDSLDVRWDFGDGSGFSDWTNYYFARHTFEASGTYTVKCQVRDNYGAWTETTMPYVIDGSEARPVVPATLTLENGRSGVLLLSNLGSVPCDFVIRSTFDSLKLTPGRGTLNPTATGSVPVAVQIDPLKTGGMEKNFAIKVAIDGTEYDVTIKAPAITDQVVEPNGPYVAYRGSKVTLDGTGTMGGYRYRWLIDGEAVSDPSASLMETITASYGVGEHTVTLNLEKGTGVVLASTNTTLTIKDNIPGLYLEEAAVVGLTVTYEPRVVPDDREGLQVRYNWDNGAGWTLWQDIAPIEHTFEKDRPYYVQCQVKDESGNMNSTALYYDGNQPLTVNAAFPDNTRDLTVNSGKPVTIKTSSVLGKRVLWRQDPFNPVRNILSASEGSEVICSTKVPGVYYIACYTANDEVVSAPQILKLTVLKGEPAPPENYVISGVVTTNTYFGSGYLGGALVRAVGDGFAFAVSNKADGTFVFDAVPAGKVYLSLSHDEYCGKVAEVMLTNSAKCVVFETEATDKHGFVYASVADDNSNFPLIDAEAQIANFKSSVTATGRTTAFTLPYGDYVMTLRYEDRGQYVTNVTASTGTPTVPVRMAGYCPYVSGFLYGTGCEIVTNAQIQVVNSKTQNIVQRYNMSGLPFFDIYLGIDQTAVLRIKPVNYDNQNYTVTTEGSFYKDFVLTPEPASLALIILALAVFARRNR